MNDSTFDDATRGAAVVSRRRSLHLLGGAGLAGAFAPDAAKAGKKTKTLCKKQRDQCRARIESFCEGSPSCLEVNFACCEHFAQCRVEAGVVCLITGVA